MYAAKSFILYSKKKLSGYWAPESDYLSETH